MSRSSRPARRRRLGPVAGLALAAMATWLATASPMAASCVVVDSVEAMVADADAAFVGVVDAVSNMDRWAIVRVEEVWHGPVETAMVEVRGGEGAGVASSVDRTYQAGTRYLFAVQVGAGFFRDSSCSMTTVWNDNLLAMRPANARATAPSPPVAAAPVDPATVLLPGLVVVAAGIVVFGVVVGLRRRA